MVTAMLPSMCSLYPFPAIRGQRVTRMGEEVLSGFRLDGDTADYLGRQNVGVFVGDWLGVSQIVDRLLRLATTAYPARWVVILPTHELSGEVYNQAAEDTRSSREVDVPDFWEYGSAVFTMPESLSRYYRDRSFSSGIAGILLLDVFCCVHKARGWPGRSRNANDRPQHVANFRADLAKDGWSPPLLFFTPKPAKSVNTESMLSPYCLEAWWFVQGGTLRVGTPPAVSGKSPGSTF